MKFCEVPLRTRTGFVRGVTIVSPEDFDRVSEFSWFINSGYAFSHIGKNRKINMGRFVMGIALESPLVVDHINNNKLDNRRENLRVVTNAENHQNIFKKDAAKHGLAVGKTFACFYVCLTSEEKRFLDSVCSAEKLKLSYFARKCVVAALIERGFKYEFEPNGRNPQLKAA